jgi:hypothetical protein
MKTMWLVVLVALCPCAVFAAEPVQLPEPPVPLDQGLQDFERNVALGAVLETRPGTEAEVVELRLLADRGLEQARALVEQEADSAEAQYLLGSWLLYGYRIVQVDQITFDAAGASGLRTVNRVIQGLVDDPSEGLGALKRATELAPDNGDYLLDYAAALGDLGGLTEARGLLKGVWAGEPQLSPAQTMRAGFLLASVAEAEDDLAAAREWVYSALALDPDTQAGVEMLRRLDAAQAAAWQAAISEVQAGYEEEFYEEEEYSEESGSGE